MNVNEQFRRFTERFQHRDPDGNVGNKAAVHHIEMDIIGTADANILHLGAKSGKISGKNRGSNFYHMLLLWRFYKFVCGYELLPCFVILSLAALPGNSKNG